MILIRISEKPQGNKKTFDPTYEIDMKKGRSRDLMEEIENAIHVEHPLTLPTDHKSSSGEASGKHKDTRFPNVIMNTTGQTPQSSSISGSVPSFPPPTYGEAYKSFRPRLQI